MSPLAVDERGPIHSSLVRKIETFLTKSEEQGPGPRGLGPYMVVVFTTGHNPRGRSVADVTTVPHCARGRDVGLAQRCRREDLGQSGQRLLGVMAGG